MRRLILGVVVMVWLVPVANADNGVLEINAACVSVGCFSGDDPGWPVKIENAGSYVLTSNLIVPDENTSGIKVIANDVGIDLNNFAIIGPVVCATMNCSHASGTGSGVERYSTSVSGISVKNGSISGMGRYGVFLGRQAAVTNLRVRWNRVDGISVFRGSTVSGNMAVGNGDDGIQTTGFSTVSGNTATSNDFYGLNFTADGSGYSENVISDNDEGTVDGDFSGSVPGGAVEFGQNVCNGNTTCP